MAFTQENRPFDLNKFSSIWFFSDNLYNLYNMDHPNMGVEIYEFDKNLSAILYSIFVYIFDMINIALSCPSP